MLRKIMGIAGLMLAAAATSAPVAQAEAAEWFYDNGTTISSTEDLHVTGEIALDVNLVSGPCTVTLEGTASNVNGMATGAITSGTIQNTCATNNPGCYITPTLQNFPWSTTGTTVTDVPGIEIVGIQFETHYHGTCPVPVSTIMATGTATATREESACFSFEEHQDDLVTHAPLPTVPVNILGTLCDTSLDLS